MRLDTKRGEDLEAVREALAGWRRTQGGRGRPIPPALWSKAADVARTGSVRVEVGDAGGVDLVAIARAFWGRRA